GSASGPPAPATSLRGARVSGPRRPATAVVRRTAGGTLDGVMVDAEPRPDKAGRPLRIAMVVPPYFEVPPRAYGGVESVVADLTDALVERGHDVTLIGVGEPRTKARFVPLWPRPIPERLGE